MLLYFPIKNRSGNKHDLAVRKIKSNQDDDLNKFDSTRVPDAGDNF